MSGVHGDIIPATARRCGSSARKWGVLPGLSDKTNGLPTDDMSMREEPGQNTPPRALVELPPVSWTSKLKSREWEAFRVCGSAVEA